MSSKTSQIISDQYLRDLIYGYQPEFDKIIKEIDLLDVCNKKKIMIKLITEVENNRIICDECDIIITMCEICGEFKCTQHPDSTESPESPERYKRYKFCTSCNRVVCNNCPNEFRINQNHYFCKDGCNDNKKWKWK